MLWLAPSRLLFFPLCCSSTTRLLREHGGSVRHRVTGDVTHLICADSSTNKAARSRSLGVQFINEQQVLELVGIEDSDPFKNEDGNNTGDTDASTTRNHPKRKRNTSCNEKVEKKSKREEKRDDSIVSFASGKCGVVDPHCNTKGGVIVTLLEEPCDVMLVQLDPIKTLDMFCVLQLISQTKTTGAEGGVEQQSQYCVFTRWGRTGTTGQLCHMYFDDYKSAQLRFLDQFEEKTGFDWQGRHASVAQEQELGAEVKSMERYRYIQQDFGAKRKRENNSVAWQYCVDDGVDNKENRWYDFGSRGSAEAERLYQEHCHNVGLGTRWIQLGETSWMYMLDLENMTQTNVSHRDHTVRRIRRLVDDDDSFDNGNAHDMNENTIVEENDNVVDLKVVNGCASDAISKTPNATTTALATVAAHRQEQVGSCRERGLLADGEEREVPGKGYKIKNVGGVYSCTCPAWRFQSKKIDVRTCKHLKELLGEEAEQKRSNVGGSRESSAKAASNSNKQANSNSKNNSAGVLFDASNLILAHKWNPDKMSPSKYLMSEKLDGMRALWNGRELVSRQGNVIDAPDFFLAGFPVHMALDGELVRRAPYWYRPPSIVDA